MKNIRKKVEVHQQDEADIRPVKLYQTEDGQSTLEVKLKDETVWLNQQQMASLFQIERSVVTKHINNIFKTGELDKNAVCAKLAHTAADKHEMTAFSVIRMYL